MPDGSSTGCHDGMATVSVLLAAACGQTDSTREGRGIQEQGLQQECRVDLAAAVCDDCIGFVHEARLGTVDGPIRRAKCRSCLRT